MSDTQVMVVVLAAVGLWVIGSVLYNAWRHPDLACRWCGGTGQVFSCSPFLRRLVAGTCWFCRGNPWRVRRLSRLFGWDRHSRYRTPR